MQANHQTSKYLSEKIRGPPGAHGMGARLEALREAVRGHLRRNDPALRTSARRPLEETDAWFFLGGGVFGML